jgi:hypothetical protein
MNDFDFLVRSWKIANDRRDRYLGEPGTWHQFPSASRCANLFAGAANLETIDFPTLGWLALPCVSSRSTPGNGPCTGPAAGTGSCSR